MDAAPTAKRPRGERPGRAREQGAAPVVNRPRGRPRDQDSAQTRQRVLDEARRLFTERGYDATTNRAIAQASGVTQSALYHYFDSKAHLYAAVYEETYDRVFDALDAAIADQPTMIEQFAAALVASAEVNVNDPALPAFDRGVTGEALRHPELNELLRPLRRRNQQFFHKMVAAAVERGELAEDVDRRSVEDLLSAVAFGLARISAVTGDAKRSVAAVEALRAFLAGTLVEEIPADAPR